MNNFQFSEINLLAVLVAWVIHIVLGLIWFQPKLFGREWMKLTGKDLNPAPNWLIPGAIGHLAMILVLVVLIKLTDTQDGLGGIFIGLLAWIGFIVPMEIGELVWEKNPVNLFLILGAWQ
jgi:hypothetical protein